MMSWITELHVVLQSIWTSLVCIFFVIFLMVVSYYPFAIVGVLLYGQNDRDCFGTVAKSFATLLEVCLLIINTIKHYCKTKHYLGGNIRQLEPDCPP